ncbi:hypothetical protein ACIBOV_19295 [Micromonospora chersina]|uniref:hypothetical protein n=1 Tax=Micromonospora chersina TaxID=47854 RepID=UPI0037B854D2
MAQDASVIPRSRTAIPELTDSITADPTAIPGSPGDVPAVCQGQAFLVILALPGGGAGSAYTAAVLTIGMNESAAAALHPLRPAAALLGAELPDELSRGVVESEGALVFAAHRSSGSPTEAIARMGWPDLTHYECQVNSFHLEDYAPVEVTLLEDGQPQIGHADQVTLLRLGLAVTDAVCGLVRAAIPGTPIRCIISANDTNGVFRFHRIRSGERWGVHDLDQYRSDMVVTVDDQP